MGVFDLTIRDLGPKGDGIHEGPRGRVFVDRAVPGDHVRARVRYDAQGVPRGEIVELVEPSAFRQPAPCVHYDRCGGCTLQHLQPDYYRRWKVAMVADA